MSATAAEPEAPSARVCAYGVAELVGLIGSSVMAAYTSLARSLLAGDRETSTAHITDCTEHVEAAAAEMPELRLLVTQIRELVRSDRDTQGRPLGRVNAEEVCHHLRHGGSLPQSSMLFEATAWYEDSGMKGVLQDLYELAGELDDHLMRLRATVASMWAANAGVDDATILTPHIGGLSCLQLIMQAGAKFSDLLAGFMAAAVIMVEEYLQAQEEGPLPRTLMPVVGEDIAAQAG